MDHPNDDPYTRISKKDEGNIGGTLSNAAQSCTNNDFRAENRALSPGHTDNGSIIMQFGEALQYEVEQETALRVPVIRLSEATDVVNELKVIATTSP